eukprot:Skav217145  [mRNA]  locus=scaffold1539:408793:410358:- [translate_table: standard]
MLMGASQADAAILLVPGDGSFTAAVAPKDRNSTGQIQGGTRQHGRLLKLLGIQQICVAVNKMDSEVARWQSERFEEVRHEMKRILKKVGWLHKEVKRIPILPISGKRGCNVIKVSGNMPWWKGDELELDQRKICVQTLYDVLDQVFRPPVRYVNLPLRMPISNVYQVDGVGEIVCGRVEQGSLELEKEVVLISGDGIHQGPVTSLQMHHKELSKALPGDLIGVHVEGLRRKPQSGDVMVYQSDSEHFSPVLCFDAEVLIQKADVKVGYCPLGVVGCSRSPCRLLAIKWKMNRSTEGSCRKMESPDALQPGDVALCTFKALKHFFCDPIAQPIVSTFCRILFLDGNDDVMLGRIVSCERQVDADKGGKKK